MMGPAKELFADGEGRFIVPPGFGWWWRLPPFHPMTRIVRGDSETEWPIGWTPGPLAIERPDSFIGKALAAAGGVKRLGDDLSIGPPDPPSDLRGSTAIRAIAAADSFRVDSGAIWAA